LWCCLEPMKKPVNKSTAMTSTGDKPTKKPTIDKSLKKPAAAKHTSKPMMKVMKKRGVKPVVFPHLQRAAKRASASLHLLKVVITPVRGNVRGNVDRVNALVDRARSACKRFKNVH